MESSPRPNRRHMKYTVEDPKSLDPLPLIANESKKEPSHPYMRDDWVKQEWGVVVILIVAAFVYGLVKALFSN